MIKFVLFGLILVHSTHQYDVEKHKSDVQQYGDPEKHHNKELKHKHLESNEFTHEHNDDDNKGKYHNDYHKKNYDKKKEEYKKQKYSKDESFKKPKHDFNEGKYVERKMRHVEGRIIDAPDLDHPLSLAKDIDVNTKMANRGENPLSEPIQNRNQLFYENMKKIDLTSPPDPNNTALMARYIVHNADWAAVATITTRLGSKNSPFASVTSMSDGPVEKGSGVPFFYLTPLDLAAQDLNKENKASVTATLAQSNYCVTSELDPQDPRCARVTLSGKVKRIKPGTLEEEFARNALFSRHPAMKNWPKDHDFYIAKLKIGQIFLLDQFGGQKSIPVDEYLNADQSNH